TELFQDELVLVVGHGHRLAGRESATLPEIKGERVILFERGASIRRATDHFFHQIGMEPSLALESNDTYFIKLMVERGLGISLLPAWAVRDEVAWGWLAKLRIEGHRLRRQVAVISLGRFQPSATRAFLEFMLERRAELQAMAEGEPARS
ncbi:MAG TPA: LysR family transcriptional regulator substrate-binding protein, partial [Vicinamibacteria bacterium]|nr:LysR family transcriptional regulator substrate-binding protein [Vicinamibacteria bacterium]